MRVFALHRAGALIALALIGVPAGLPATGSEAMAQTPGQTMTTPSGLQIQDTTVGAGPKPKPGQICVMHYTGWLYENGAKGKKFDSSLDRGEPFEFKIAAGQVIRGWDEGVADDAGGRKAHAHHTGGPGLRLAGRGRRHSAERHADFRG